MRFSSRPEAKIPSSIKIEIAGYSVELPPRTVQALAGIATRNGLEYDEYGIALQQAIVNENFLEKLEEDGYQLLIQERNGRVRQLIRT